eukprot:GHVQ01025290.1.p1 GENE.GHVQ01025290.1~~GHVQ01025290.1.p1  ORF type:complete len:356 (-),score=30.11 GHVQ01025290.1:522-1589(-)
MEISLRHILPNFWECWWDHVLLDVLGCNLLGIMAGLRLCGAFGMKEYKWEVGASKLAGGIRRRSIALLHGIMDIYGTTEMSHYGPSSVEEQRQSDQQSDDISKKKDDYNVINQSGNSAIVTRHGGITKRIVNQLSDTNIISNGSPNTVDRNRHSDMDTVGQGVGHIWSECVKVDTNVVSKDIDEYGVTSVCSMWNRFTPYEWTEYRWPSALSNYQTFVSLLIFSVCVTLLDLNLFFLKTELWLEPDHWINTTRTFFWGAAAASGTRQFYEYVTDMNVKRMGLQCWLDLAMVSTELLLAIKWRNGLPSHGPMPTWIAISWTLIGILLVSTFLWIFFFPQKNRKNSLTRGSPLSSPR